MESLKNRAFWFFNRLVDSLVVPWIWIRPAGHGHQHSDGQIQGLTYTWLFFRILVIIDHSQKQVGNTYPEVEKNVKIYVILK